MNILSKARPDLSHSLVAGDSDPVLDELSRACALKRFLYCASWSSRGAFLSTLMAKLDRRGPRDLRATAGRGLRAAGIDSGRGEC